jgi:hypothetical protein
MMLLGWLAAPGTAVARQGTASRAATTETRGLRRALMREISSSSTFSGVNRNDARAAFKVWLDVVARQRGFLLDTTVDILDSLTEIRARLESHSVELVTLGAGEYKVWLEVLLGKEKLGRAASFFASVKEPDKAQACILPLFFGAVDACVVDEISLNLAKEMNPQLGELRVLARSRPMIEGVVATPVEPRPHLKEMIDAMLSLHEDPRGRQLLMAFRTTRMVRIQPGDLESARELWRDYHRLPGSPPLRPAGFAPVAESKPADRGKERN